MPSARHAVGKDTIARIWRSRGLRSWRADTFKLSTDPDPDFEIEVIDVVGPIEHEAGSEAAAVVEQAVPIRITY